MRCSAIAILVAGVLISGTAFAGSPQGRQHDDSTAVRISEFKQQAKVLEGRFNPTGAGKLSPIERDELAREQREIRRMIKQLESGGAVEPREMERAR